ncbi:hypothetical protein [Mycobacteroides abscessus]|uniref:hypothetical protein n=1 Tax=Mycobacteroides abscessus TaxID=36809 RepID=UPI000C25744D|nr:hypothetical protein [Mycobacteroides abscessus]
MTSEDDQGAADMAAIRDVLGGLDVDDALGGESGQLVRQALAEHGRRAEVLGDAARAVAEAVQTRQANIAERDAATPSDSEIRAAQEAVVRASNAYADGTGTKEQLDGAISELARLQRAKRVAQNTFQEKERAGADKLESATQGLPDASAGGPGGPMGSLLSMLGNMKPPQAPMASPMPAGAGGDPGAVAQPASYGGIDPALADLLAGDDPLDSGGAFGPLGEGEGQTHVSSDDGFVRQPQTLTGVQTAADISGRSGNSMSGSGALGASGAGVGGAGMGGMGAPMVPPPMGGARPNSDKKQQGEANIMNTDPDMTGDDIDVSVASSGVLGRAERRTS